MLCSRPLPAGFFGVYFQPGDRIERYIIDAPLGQGGMGEVYRAHDERLQRSVALKILRVAAAGSSGGAKSPSEGAARMLREARAVAALDHPNVVAIYDVGQLTEPDALRGTTYIAMELVKGEPLRKRIGDARVPIEERVRWLADIARALAAAHGSGIVHRDVKPENVLIREDGRVKVLDFGIAKRSGRGAVDASAPTEDIVATVTAEGVVMGTPLYMAPEQLRGEPLDGRADQFAWATVAYELLRGKPPWSDESGSIAIVAQVLFQPAPPIPPEEGVPPNVEAAVLRALSKDRAARFETMDALLAALEAPGGAASGGSPRLESRPIASSSERAASGAPAPSPRGEPDPQIRAPVAGASSYARAATPARTRAAPRAEARGVRAAIAGTATVTLAVVLAVAWRARAPNDQVAATAAPPSAADDGRCASDRACVESHGGQPYVCRASDRTCVSLDSTDCKALYEPLDLVADDTVWLGSMFPRKGPAAAEYGDMHADGVDFARREIARATAALTRPGAAHVRRIGLIACDDSEDPTRAARHLVDEVGVPAILGFRSGQELVDLAEGLLIPRGVVSVASLTANPTITHLPQPQPAPRLVWRTLFGLGALGEATAHLVHDAIEPRAGAAGANRLVLVRGDSVSAMSFAGAFYRDLVLNGKPAIDGGDTYREIAIAADGSDVNAAAERVQAASPTIVVIVFPAGKGLPELVEAIESRSAGARRPTYVLVNETLEKLAPFLAAGPDRECGRATCTPADRLEGRDGGRAPATPADRRRRLFAIAPPSNSLPNARFVIRYDEAGRRPVSRERNPASSYDAFYLLAYGVLALGKDEPVSGAAIARTFARLVPPGRTTEVGPENTIEALGVLRSGGSIDLEGAQSGLDFDLTSGEAPSDFALLCPSVGPDGGASGDGVESGAVYRAKSRRTEGAIHCSN